MECLNVHIILPQVIAHGLICKWVFTHCYQALRMNSNNNKQSDGETPVMLELWGMQMTPSLPSLPGPLRPRVVAPLWVLTIGQIELNYVLILNWIVWNRTFWHLNCILRLNWIGWNKTVFSFSWHLNCVLHLNCLLMLNWIVWNGTVFYLETVLTLNWIVQNRTVYLYKNRFGIK